MRWLVAAVLLSVPLGGGFGEAAASATVNNGGGLDVRLQVEVAADTVVAHVIDPGGDQETVSLDRRSDGTFGGFVATERSNRVVVFEALVAAESVTSRPVTLLELGVAPSLLGIDEGPNLLEGDEAEPTVIFGLDRRRSAWAAVALGALSLTFLTWWAAGGRRPGTPEPDDQEDGAES